MTLFLVGAAVAFFSARNLVIGGLRMLGIGGAAAAATFLTGQLVGSGLSS